MRAEDCVLYAPVPHETPLRDMLRSRVSITLTGHQRKNGILSAGQDILSKLARLLGAECTERMTKGVVVEASDFAVDENLERAGKNR